MTTTIYFSNRFDVLSYAFNEFLNTLSDPLDMFSTQTLVIVPSMATADYITQQICDHRTIYNNNNELLAAGVVTKLNFVELTRFIELLTPRKKHLLKRNVIFATLLELEKQSNPQSNNVISEQLIARLNTSAMQIEKALYANTHATRLDPQKWSRFTATEIGKKTTQILDFIEDKFKNSNPHPVLPFELLSFNQQELQFDFSKLPETVLWFDPDPLGQFEQFFFGQLIEYLQLHKNETNTRIAIFSFSPCQEYWEDVKTGHNTPLTQPDANDVSPTSDDDQSILLDHTQSHFLLSRCGRIPQCVGRALYSYITQLDTVEYKLHLPSEEHAQSLTSTLHTIQQNALNRTHTTRIIPDDSFQISAFESARETSSWIAEKIKSLLDTDESLNCEDITILVPSGIASNYAAFLHAALVLKHIPVNIRGIINTNQETCFDALDALIQLLNGQFTRQTVLNWMFLPAIMPKDLQPYKNTLIRWINKYGILRDIDGQSRNDADYLKNDPAYTWTQGIERIALGFAHNNETSDDFFPSLSESERIICIQWLAHIRALFADIRELRNATLTWPQWQNVIFNLLNAWIDDDAQNRDDEMKQIQAAMNASWPSFRFGWHDDAFDDYTDQNDVHPIQDVLPMLKLVSAKLVQAYPGQMFGGVQVRPLTTDTQTSKIVFMVGLENANFPSKTPRKKALERFSRYDLDAYAFLKWFNNATEKLYLCAQLLEVGERETFKHNINESENIKKSISNTIDKLAQRASVFLSDIITRLEKTEDTLQQLIPEVKEPVNRERIKALADIKHFVQKKLNSKINNTDDTEDLYANNRRIPAEWSRIEQTLNENNISTSSIKSSVFNNDISNLIFNSCNDPSNNNDGEVRTITISFKNLYNFLTYPRSTYRKAILNINEYEDTLPSELKQLNSEPFELKKTSGLYETFILKSELLNVHLTHFKSDQKTLEDILNYILNDYKLITDHLRKQGAWPAGYYDDLQFQRDKQYFYTLLSSVENAITHSASGFIYIINGGIEQARLNVNPPPVFRQLSLNEIPVSTDTHFLINGTFVPMFDEDTMIISENDSYNQIYMASLILAAIKSKNNSLTLPHKAIIIPKKEEEIKYIDFEAFINQLTQDPQQPFELLQFYLRFIHAGYHEMTESGIEEKNTRHPFRMTPEKQEPSEIYKYAGSPRFIPQKTFEHWSIWFDHNNTSADKEHAETFIKLRNCLADALKLYPVKQEKAKRK